MPGRRIRRIRNEGDIAAPASTSFSQSPADPQINPKSVQLALLDGGEERRRMRVQKARGSDRDAAPRHASQSRIACGRRPCERCVAITEALIDVAGADQGVAAAPDPRPLRRCPGQVGSCPTCRQPGRRNLGNSNPATAIVSNARAPTRTDPLARGVEGRRVGCWVREWSVRRVGHSGCGAGHAVPVLSSRASSNGQCC